MPPKPKPKPIPQYSFEFPANATAGSYQTTRECDVVRKTLVLDKAEELASEAKRLEGQGWTATGFSVQGRDKWLLFMEKPFIEEDNAI